MVERPAEDRVRVAIAIEKRGGFGILGCGIRLMYGFFDRIDTMRGGELARVDHSNISIPGVGF